MNADDYDLEPLVTVQLVPEDNYRITPPNGETLKIAHISDTHFGLKEREVYVQGRKKSRPVTKQVSAFQNFRELLSTIQALDPDVIIHTGDVIDKEILNCQDQIKSQLPTPSEERLFLYVRGNHDTHAGEEHIHQLFTGWDVYPLADVSPISLADGQLILLGRDYQDNPTQEAFDMDSLDIAEESLVVGSFHQAVRQISQSYDADTDLMDLVPDGESVVEYYDLLLFGHMHTDHLDLNREYAIIDGGSASGLNTTSEVGLLIFSTGTSKYERFRL